MLPSGGLRASPTAPGTISTSASTGSLPALNTTSATANLSAPQGRRSLRIKDSFAILAAQDKALAGDPKWRKYSSLVEKTLQSFESVNEWADFITFLAKLLKCLQGCPQFPIIPHKLTVAKRLSQCLNPALPTGVHQRALDVYTYILTTIGPENLRRDLPAWSSGLFPFFQYAATSVKPIVLGIYERFYIPLQESLRPATKAFILALLPGLEEETGEFFEKVAALLDRLSGTVSPSFFFQNVWLVLITAPNSRIPALNYLSRRLPKMQSEDSVTHIVGEDIGLMVRGLSAALEDSQILVQRGILDLLTTTLKLDSVGLKSTTVDDRILLMRAVVGVVLRRDLSLSRRLYTWLLGNSDDPAVQVAHLKEHGLDLLKSALKAEMTVETSNTADRQRPFKIFISLLDKWEIGASLTEVLVLDAFTALKSSLRPDDDHDELLMTGNMLFEILDPFLMWRQIYASICSAMNGKGGSSPIELAHFIIKTFRVHDEEVQKLHAPLIAFSIIDMAGIAVTAEFASEQASIVRNALELAAELLHETPVKVFTNTSRSSTYAASYYGKSSADALYAGSDSKSQSLREVDIQQLLISAFNSTLLLITELTRDSTRDKGNDSRVGLMMATFSILDVLCSASSHSSDSLQVEWIPERWSSNLTTYLTSVETSATNFALHSSIIRSILRVTSSDWIQPNLKPNNRLVIEALASKALDYLQPPHSSCFVEAVQLVWGIETLSNTRLVESLISLRLSSNDLSIRLTTFEAFGNLWRFTNDSQLPGVVLRTPMLIMLDSLKAEDLSTRRAGEAWMRCSLKSYIRVLDPLIFRLLDPKIKQHKSVLNVDGLNSNVLLYRNIFNQGIVHHTLDNLLSLVRFGGQGFIRIAKASFLKHTLDPALRERVRASELDTQTYLDALITILVRFLRAEPEAKLISSLQPLNYHIHSTVAETLQVLISRGESDIIGVQEIESALTTRLYLCIHRSELDLQNKLLHVLHSVLLVTGSSRLSRRHQKETSISAFKTDKVETEEETPELGHEALFVRVVSDAISLQQNCAVIHHWIDFLLMTIAQFRYSVQTVIFPLLDCLVIRLRSLVAELERTYIPDSKDPVAIGVTDAEYTVLVNAMERLLLMAISDSLVASADEEPKAAERSQTDVQTSGPSGGLLGYMTGVLGTTEIEHTEISEESKLKMAGQSRLRDCVNLLLLTWNVTTGLDLTPDDEVNTSAGYFCGRTRLRARKALERIYKSAPSDVLEVIIQYWGKAQTDVPNEVSNRIFLIIDVLSPSAQVVVTMMSEKLVARTSASSDKSRPNKLSDSISFAFLDAYIARMEGAIAVQVWGSYLSFAREYLSNLSANRAQIFFCLKCFTTLSEKVSQTSALEDRRLRRDLQETFIRLTDAAVQEAGRVVERGGWRKRTPNIDVMQNGHDNDTDSVIEKGKEEIEGTEDDKRMVPPLNQAHDITKFLATRVLADFRRFLIDADKTVAVCSNMIYYIVAPAFKSRSRNFDVEPAVFDLLIQMAENPTTLKAWRTQVADAFADSRFFNAPPQMHAKWKPLIRTLMASDKERLPDLSAKISTVSSANIFTNRELESLSRALSLRRLTYTIFTGEKDRFLTQLPLIQEKLVDLLRSSVGDMVHAEVYLCLRVLFCRVGHHHLAGLWPVILTELLRLFDSLVEVQVPDKSDLLQLVLSACKFLDLTLVLQTEEFQIHEWMFVTDTVDAIYPPDSWLPQAIMDRLGEVFSNMGATNRSPDFSNLDPSALNGRSESSARKPSLTARRMETLSEMEPFFSSISLLAYESVYNCGGKIDWPAVEKLLERDLFDGD